MEFAEDVQMSFNSSLYERKYKQPLPRIALRQSHQFIDNLFQLLFPQCSSKSFAGEEDFEDYVLSLQRDLEKILACHEQLIEPNPRIKNISTKFFYYIEELESMLMDDAIAIDSGDPASSGLDEVIICYPGFYAVCLHRMAHFFYLEDVPLLPRIVSEYAHRLTGIDIHPGAKIGKRFCIDHGTGVVIGETSVLGNNVKIYQGVTLGALSVSKSLAMVKRHPTVEDDCVIYSNATILGGDTVIGKGSIVGGNVWVNQSVPPGTKIYHSPLK
jgi:serine O-acetyltransferase